MLFLSRCVHRDEGEGVGTTLNFEVVDTDDGVEQVVGMVEVVDAICNHGLNIAGFEMADYGHTENITPYQDIRSMTAYQTKLSVVSHVLVTRYKNMITSINFDGSLIDKPVSIRLSSLGRSCADYLLISGKHYDKHKITLVFDDRIDFTSYSFATVSRFSGRIGVDGYGVVFDLRELSSDVLAERIYRNVCDSGSRFNSIYDGSARRQRMQDKLIPQGWYKKG